MINAERFKQLFGFTATELWSLPEEQFLKWLNNDAIPAADVRPVVRAYWKSVPYKRARVCSHCEADEPYKFADDDANVYNFCPNCGAKMDGESNV
jgi:hypothetical protein